jgi:hypothetical protein
LNFPKLYNKYESKSDFNKIHSKDTSSVWI